MEFDETNIDIENATLPGQFDDFPLPVFDPRQIPFSPTSPGKRSPGRPRTMKEYEEDLASLKKENFNLKVRIYFLEQHRIDPSLPKDVDELRHLYTNLQVEHELQKKDLEAKENLLLDTYKALDVQKQELESMKEEKQELCCRIENLEKELKDYHQRFMETSVPHLDDTNALYTMTFGFNAKVGPSKADPSSEEKIRELQESLSKEKERNLVLEEEIKVLSYKNVDDRKSVLKLQEQQQEMEEKLVKVLHERNKFEALYSTASDVTAKLQKNLKRRIESIKDKEVEAEKWKLLAEELRKQLTSVENQLQEIQEIHNKSQRRNTQRDESLSEKQMKMLYAENEKLKQEVIYLQRQLEKRTSRGQSSEPGKEHVQQLKETQQRHLDLVRENETLKAQYSQSKRFIQAMYKEKKQLQAENDELKGTIRNLSTNSTESSKEEVSFVRI